MLSKKVIYYSKFGITDYADALHMQMQLVQRKLKFYVDDRGRYVLNERILQKDYLLLMEHNSVYTGGKRSQENMVVDNGVGNKIKYFKVRTTICNIFF